MAKSQVQFVRDCVNPGLVLEREDPSYVRALHIDIPEMPEPECVFINGVKYARAA